jgi:hypothetical protein
MTENENVPEAKASESEATDSRRSSRAEVVGDKTEASTLVDTLFDIGLAWAEFGVGQGKKALETSAKTLEKVAATLDDLQQKLRKDAA